MQLWQRIQDALLNIVRDRFPEEALTQEPSHEYFLDTTFIDNDEINLTALAKELAGAINVKVD